MSLGEAMRTRRSATTVGIVGGSWVVLALLCVLTWATWSFAAEKRDSDPPAVLTSNVGWGAGTLAVVLVIAALIAVMLTSDGTRRDDVPQSHDLRQTAVPLCLATWLLGGCFNLFVFLVNVLPLGDGTAFCDSAGNGTFACENQPGPGLIVLGMASSFSATTPTLLSALIWARSGSRLSAWLSPVVVLALYLLALRLWLPHEGPGVLRNPQL